MFTNDNGFLPDDLRENNFYDIIRTPDFELHVNMFKELLNPELVNINV